MTTVYDQLSTEEQIELGAEYVALSTPLPEGLRASLFAKGLLELVLHPEESYDRSKSITDT